MANHKEELLRMLWGMGNPPPEDEETEDEMAPGNGTTVTRSHLGDILAVLEERHIGLVNLMQERFSSMEALSLQRMDQIDEAKREIKEALKIEVSRNDRRFNLIAGSVLVAFLAEAARFIWK